MFAVLILCDDSTGCDEIHDYFAPAVDSMISTLYVRLT